MRNDSKVKEIIRFCIHAHFKKQNLPISKTRLLKFLYKATNRVPVGNSLRKCIPFYWYIHGPYSEPLLELVQQMTDEQIIRVDRNGYMAAGRRLCEYDEDLIQVRERLADIIGESTSSSAIATIEELYREEAPYGFYVSFKSKFHGMLNNYLHDDSTRYRAKDLEAVLHQAIGELPNRTLFSQFKYAYLDFIAIMTRLAESELTEESKTRIKQSAQDVFETFAKGVRILEHDPHFERMVPIWNKEFEESVRRMEQNIDMLHALATSTGSGNTNRISFSTLVKKALELKSRGRLAMVSFLPTRNNVQSRHGQIDAALFKKMTDGEFQDLLRGFEGAHNAIICQSTGHDLKSTTYRLSAS